MPQIAVDLVAITDFRLIALSVLISLIGAYTALDIADQIPPAPEQSRSFWWFASGITLGLSIWAMHFTGILAHTLPIPVSFDFSLILLSMVVAVIGGIWGIWLIDRPGVAWVFGGIFIGITIIAMHFISMAALRMEAIQVYDPILVMLSSGIAIAASLISLWFLRQRTSDTMLTQCWRVVKSALVMGAAISGMHYTAMVATHVRSASVSLPQLLPIDSRVLAIVIGIAALLILIVALVASFFGRRLSAEVARVEALRSSESRLEQLVQQRTQELELEKLASEAANEAKSAFLANTSHELRTPLTAIVGFSSVLLKQVFGPLNARQLDYVQRISNSGYQLLALINDLLDLAKVESGREAMALESVLVEAVCQACIDTVREQAEQRGLQLGLSIDPQVITCTADERRLTQILLNLLSNAIKFTETGSITLEVQPVKDRVEFAVSDTGIGIDPADLTKLFQPFQQLDSSFTRKYQGTGLGLALSQKLAQLQGGNITVSSAPGAGSCFILSLPC